MAGKIPKFTVNIDAIKGFLDPREGQELYDRCLAAGELGPTLEIGSYCGKSTVYLGEACRLAGRSLFAVDHHRGSEEHQPGEFYHDPELFDSASGLVDTFRLFRQTLREAGLEQVVVPIVAATLGMVFIDGGHSFEAAQADYDCWARHIRVGGILAIHDIFPNPNDGGQAPYSIWQQAIASGLFEDLGVVCTLGVLRRKDG